MYSKVSAETYSFIPKAYQPPSKDGISEGMYSSAQAPASTYTTYREPHAEQYHEHYGSSVGSSSGSSVGSSVGSSSYQYPPPPRQYPQQYPPPPRQSSYPPPPRQYPLRGLPSHQDPILSHGTCESCGNPSSDKGYYVLDSSINAAWGLCRRCHEQITSSEQSRAAFIRWSMRPKK